MSADTQEREKHFAEVLLCWVAVGRRSLRIEHDGLTWRLDARDEPWALTAEGASFSEAADALTRFAPARFEVDE